MSAAEFLPAPAPVRTDATDLGRVHRSSHLSLLVDLRPDERPEPAITTATRAVDAVAVLAHRGAERVREAARLADDVGAVLLAVCSGRVTALDVVLDLQRWTPELAVLAVQHSYLDGIARIPLQTARFPANRTGKYADVAAKRNLVLMVARQLGWRTVFCLDDDIDQLTGRQLLAAAGQLHRRRLAALGLHVSTFQDNSVVCHGNRLAGHPQESFIGANALLVRLDARTGFFPPVYNEDWLFLFDAVRAGEVGVTGRVRQLGFNPFQNPARARQEEFGDVLAEGLYNLLHEDRDLYQAQAPDYWRRELAGRHATIERIVQRLVRAEPSATVEQALLSLAAATGELATIEAEALAWFVQAWRRDLRRWRDGVGRIRPTPSSVERAMDRLGLDYVATDRALTA